MQGPPRACSSCIHLRHTTTDGHGTCDAFMEGDGIPEAILLGENDHTQPVAGDRGIQWELHPRRQRQHEAYLRYRERTNA